MERNTDRIRTPDVSLKERLRLYVVSDRLLAAGRSEEEILLQAARGGATAFQLRGKDSEGRELYQLAVRLRTLSHQLGILFIVNDRVDIALASGAEGVHLGQSDLPLSAARQLMGPGAIIGLSANTVAEARVAEAEGADYIGASPVWSTPTKTDTEQPLGPEGLTEMCKAVSVPVVGIGGINKTNAHQVIEAGAAGVAVVSAVVAAMRPKEAAEELLIAMNR